MPMKKRLPVAFLVTIFTILAVVSPFASLRARTLSDIEDDINEQQDHLGSIEEQLAKANSELAALNSEIGQTQGEIPKLKAQIKKLEATIKSNTLQLEILEETSQLKILEKEEREAHQDIAVNHSYRNWKATNRINANLTGGISKSIKSRMYQAQVIAVEQGDIDDLGGEILGILDEITAFETETASLKEQNQELKKQKEQLEYQLALLNSSASNVYGHVAGLRADAAVVQSNIEQLSDEQKARQQYEAWLLTQGSNSDEAPQVLAGEFYFVGQGRDLYQGHGVGLSQFGAYGAALSGWSAADILAFYYKDTHLESKSKNVKVEGFGTMTADEYVAGLGEVPDKACGTAQQVADRPDKYVLDNTSTVWDCWPEEAIKAQVIAARNYAVYYNESRGGQPICTSAVCQVYKGGNAKQWAATETSKKFVVSHGATHNGQLINALYSSDNNQGHGTANNDTVWSYCNPSTMTCGGTPYSYLRGVDDSAFALPYAYTNWMWDTNGYNMQDMTNLLNVNRNGNTYINNLYNQIGGQVAAVSFERDPSERVTNVIFTGTNGVSRPLAGWSFKAAWNNYVYEVPRSQSYVNVPVVGQNPSSVVTEAQLHVQVGTRVEAGTYLSPYTRSTVPGKVGRINKNAQGHVTSIDVSVYDYMYSLTFYMLQG